MANLQKTSIVNENISSTTKKYNDFTSEPLGDKLVSCMPGIGKAYEKALVDKHIVKAYQLVGHFLCLMKDEEKMQSFLIAEGGLKKDSAKICTNAISQWVSNYV